MLKAISNTIANFIGGLASLGAILVFNALYFRMVSGETYGIISLLLTAIFVIPAFDMGTSRTAGRILARDLATQQSTASARNATATLQITNLAIGLALGTVFALAAPTIATSWLRPAEISISEVSGALVLLAAIVALMVPRFFITSCLNGMKRQILANLLQFSFVMLRGIAGLLALSIYENSLLIFFVVQLGVQAAETLVSAFLLWRFLPATEPGLPRFDSGVLWTSWRFATGDGAASFIGTVLAQGDKILLSALLPLSVYGTYALISTIASGVGRFTGAFSAAFLPHYVELYALERKDELRADYLLSTQLLSCVILPLTATLIAFAPEIIAAVIGKDQPLGLLPSAFALLVAATMLNNLQHLPHGIQLAAGNSVTALRFTFINAIIYVGLILILTPRLGILGPATSLFAIQTVTLFLFARVSGNIVDLGLADWLGNSVIRPGLSCALAIGIAWLVVPGGLGLVGGAITLVVVSLVGFAAALALSPGARAAIAEYSAIIQRQRAGS